MHIQTLDKSVADINVDIDIGPTVQGEIDSVKLERFLRAFREFLSGMFASPPKRAFDVIGVPCAKYTNNTAPPGSEMPIGLRGTGLGSMSDLRQAVDGTVEKLGLKRSDSILTDSSTGFDPTSLSLLDPLEILKDPDVTMKKSKDEGAGSVHSDASSELAEVSSSSSDESSYYSPLSGDDSWANSPARKGGLGPANTVSERAVLSPRQGLIPHDRYRLGDETSVPALAFPTITAANLPKYAPSGYSSYSRGGLSSKELRVDLDAATDKALIAALDVISTPHSITSPADGTAKRKDEEQDPASINVDINVRLPEVALNLNYDPPGTNHQSLAVRKVGVRVMVRPHDLQVLCELGEIALQDTWRCEEQKYLLHTPTDHPCMVSIAFKSIKNRKSPIFRNHAKEFSVAIKELQWFTDIHTMAHIRPFVEVILAREDPVNPGQQGSQAPSSPIEEWSDDGGDSNDDSDPDPDDYAQQSISQDTKGSSSMLSDEPSPDESPKGWAVTVDVEEVGLHLLKECAAKTPQAMLQNTFALEVFGLRVKVESKGLLHSDVRFRSVDIVDARANTGDYVFRKVFCPVVDLEAGTHNQKPSYSPSRKQGVDLVHVIFHQEAKDLSFVTVQVQNTSTFVAMDTILDLQSIFFSNLFAFLETVAHPQPKKAPVVPAGQSTSAAATAIATNVDGNGKVGPLQVPEETLAVVRSPSRFSTALLSTTTLNVNVSVVNPRLIVLDDPTSEETRAIVSQSEIEVHYTREVRQFAHKKELHESLHVSLLQTELFVILNMLSWHPQPILEPFGLEFHLRRKSVDGKAVASDMSLDTDSIRARVSINDVVLAQSIITRRALIESPADTGAKATSTPSSTSSQGLDMDDVKSLSPLTPTSPFNAQDMAAVEEASKATPTYTLSLNLGKVTLVTVNDFNGQNMPLIRTVLDGLTFYAEGFHVQRQIKGEGSVIATADFFNSRLALWEPVLDRWHPTASLVTMGRGVNLDIKSEHTTQITVSGTMLEKLLQTYSILLRLDDIAERENVPEVTVNNLLGVPIDIFDSASNVRILKLGPIASAAVPEVADAHRLGFANPVHVPSAVDLHFAGKLGEDRMPLMHLPFNINKPRIHNLQHRDEEYDEGWGIDRTKRRSPRESPGHLRSEECIQAEDSPTNSRSDQGTGTRRRTTSTGSGASSAASVTSEDLRTVNRTWKNSDENTKGMAVPSDPRSRQRRIVIEPIVEEVFETNRYDPLNGVWKRPYLVGDPPSWTDANGTQDRDILSIEPISDKWEWLDTWTVDMQGKLGEEIDGNGWEYANSFSHFSMVSNRRVGSSMDCCRRRRWTRTRIPASATMDHRDMLLTVFWDVKALSNGGRKASFD